MMRVRFSLVAVVVFVALALAVLAMGSRRADDTRPHHRHPAATAAMPRPLDLGQIDETSGGWADDVMPMHRAVRLVGQRYSGKIIDIQLVAERHDEIIGHPLTYRIRLLTRSRDVLDIRMDAFTGRFLDVRGADVAAARRHGQDKDH